MKTIIIDGKNKVMGRLASTVAKLLLQGNKVIVLNAKDIVITGSRNYTIELWEKRFSRSDIGNPRRYGPKISVRPDFFFKRVVRGMLPRKQAKGRMALKNLKVYIGTPEEYKNKDVLELKNIEPKSEYLTRNKIITIGELVTRFGWKGDVQ